MELFNDSAKAQIRHIPYKGAAPHPAYPLPTSNTVAPGYIAALCTGVFAPAGAWKRFSTARNIVVD